jgi:imidazolonepropionase-like amidohydrolase
LVDSFWGDQQTIAPEELKAVVAEAHRRNAQVAIHSRGAGSTRAAAEANVDWIMHADQASQTDLEVVAERSIPIMPTAFLIKYSLDLAHEGGESSSDLDPLKRAWDGTVNMLQIARKLGIKMLCGTDTGAIPIIPYGKYHASEMEILTKYGGYTTMEAIVAMTKNNALTIGLENDLGVIQPGKLADLLILNANPLEDIRILQDSRYLTSIIKDGEAVVENDKALHQTQLGENRLLFHELARSRQ